MKKSDLFKVFMTMMKIGLFTFGGGYAMLALLEHEFVEKKGVALERRISRYGGNR